ncbi:MAG: Glycosyl phosphatidyl inositol anchor synthesis [Sarcosagium campestre]|nr:MAG: Glycosyl phosphatidyl inositol anchor synthesis [Sarcosagium campestre]
MARVSRSTFLAVAFAFHLIYIYSIFDIYFVSPIVSGMTEHKVERAAGIEAPAKRLVLYVGDGLRADKAFQSFPDPSPERPNDASAQVPRPLAPFLRSRVESHGTFGVSHTRMPTESRPGHVALIAGLYEDVSSVTTGWKLNPVNFDSVFNRSRHTWSWGSPDILPMFKEGAVPGRVDADVYGHEVEDFSLDATQLDTWVFDRVTTLFQSAATNATLDAALREDRVVFFLHLLGLDTSGHAYRPYSKEYLHNIKIVDEGVKKITKLIETFYGDGKTAFVFTADHGMSDWGSHGDGHPDNTRTPLIAWGSGVAKPVIARKGLRAAGHEDGFSADWGLDHVARHDVSQADVAALMAYLPGLDFPVNSVGELPLPYLAGDLKEKAEAALVNAKSVLEMYRVKEEQKKSTELRYRPYPALGDSKGSASRRLAEIRELIDNGSFELAISKSVELLKLGLAGLRYLQTYDWLFLRGLVTLGYLGWIAFAFTTVIDAHVLHGKSETARTTVSVSFFSSLLVLLYAMFLVQRAPITYYAYAFFPVAFWEEVFARRTAIIAGAALLVQDKRTASQYLQLGGNFILSVALLESLVLGYFERRIFSIIFVAAACWPLTYGRSFLRANPTLVTVWAALSLTMSCFTLLPAIKVESLTQISAGGLLMLAAGIGYLPLRGKIGQQSASTMSKGQSLSNATSVSLSALVIGIQTGLIALALVVTRSSVQSLQAKLGLPLGTQLVGWVVLILSLTVPFLHTLDPNPQPYHRLLILFLTFSPAFIILTISYEGLFFVAFTLTLLAWTLLEQAIFKFQAPPGSTHTSTPNQFRTLALSDLRIALFLFTLLQSAFFSTGNIASVSSFSLEAVYRLIPVFSPFGQGALLILKLMIPFALISAFLAVLNLHLRLPPSALFMCVMAISDVLTLNFFWQVKDEGSWLDIGTTISHFSIASLLCVFVAGLEGLGDLFTRGVVVSNEKGPIDKAVVSNGVRKS